MKYFLILMLLVVMVHSGSVPLYHNTSIAFEPIGCNNENITINIYFNSTNEVSLFLIPEISYNIWKFTRIGKYVIELSILNKSFYSGSFTTNFRSGLYRYVLCNNNDTSFIDYTIQIICNGIVSVEFINDLDRHSHIRYIY